MKRSTCLSALFVALSLTSVASAAPTASPDSKTPANQATNAGKHGTLVAQNDDDSNNTNGTNGAPAAPASAPSDGAGTATTATPQAAVTIGAGTQTQPAKDTTQASAEQPQAKPKPRPFAGTQVFLQQAMSTATVFRGQRQYSDATVNSTAYISPRFRPADWLQIRGRLYVQYEETNSDKTKYLNEPMISDTSFQFYYMKIPEFGGGFKALLGPYLSLPTSKYSRSATEIFAPGVTGQISRSFDGVLWGGDLWMLGYSYYTHPIYQSNTQTITENPPPGGFQCAGGQNCSDVLRGTMNSSDTVVYAAVVGANFGKWSPAINYAGYYNWYYHPKDVTYADVTPGGSNTSIPSSTNNPTNVQQTHYLSAWLDYMWNGWLTSEVGYWQTVNVLAADGKYTNPVFSQYAGAQYVYLGVNVNIDELLKELEGGGGKGGIVRAQNSRKPFGTF